MELYVLDGRADANSRFLWKFWYPYARLHNVTSQISVKTKTSSVFWDVNCKLPFLAGFMLCLFFYPEDGSDMFLPNMLVDFQWTMQYYIAESRTLHSHH